VGGPPSAALARDPDERLRDVDDQGASEVVTRALRNYLAGDGDQLSADLAASARVQLPALRLRLSSVDSLKWAPGSSAVIAVVECHGKNGARWTLRYELDVTQVAGRWQITAIEPRSR
jgi:hypothetical protein